MMEYREFYLNPVSIFVDSERVLRFNIEIFNRYIGRVGDWESDAPDMVVMSMRESLDSMRRLGTVDLFGEVSGLIGSRIEQLKVRGDKGLSYVEELYIKKGIKFLEGYIEMFDILKKFAS